MQQQPLSQSFTITLTEAEKQMLVDLALSRGATMRGVIRKLIRDAAERTSGNAGATRRRPGRRHAGGKQHE